MAAVLCCSFARKQNNTIPQASVTYIALAYFSACPVYHTWIYTEIAKPCQCCGKFALITIAPPLHIHAS